MATLTTTQTSPSLLGGVVIIGGTIIGAGMFSLPVVMSGAVSYTHLTLPTIWSTAFPLPLCSIS